MEACVLHIDHRARLPQSRRLIQLAPDDDSHCHHNLQNPIEHGTCQHASHETCRQVICLERVNGSSGSLAVATKQTLHAQRRTSVGKNYDFGLLGLGLTCAAADSAAAPVQTVSPHLFQ
jgi:hypothetical protein